MFSIQVPSVTALGSTLRRAALALSAAALLATSLTGSALAQTSGEATINQQIKCERRGNYQVILGVKSTPQAVDFSESAQSTDAALNLRAGYTGGCTQDGWKVTLVSSNMVADGVGQIAAENVRAASLSDVTWVSGQTAPLPVKNSAVNQTPLNAPVRVLSAAQNAGMGLYEEGINLQLQIPGYSLPGTYAVKLTATITAGPN